MVITAAELKTNIGRYLDAVTEDEVFITRDGKIVAKLTGAGQDKQAILDSLVGITAANPVSLEEARKERLLRLVGSISHEDYLEIEKALEETERVYPNEW